MLRLDRAELVAALGREPTALESKMIAEAGQIAVDIETLLRRAERTDAEERRLVALRGMRLRALRDLRHKAKPSKPEPFNHAEWLAGIERQRAAASGGGS